jgi:hypothetical protein
MLSRPWTKTVKAFLPSRCLRLLAFNLTLVVLTWRRLNKVEHLSWLHEWSCFIFYTLITLGWQQLDPFACFSCDEVSYSASWKKSYYFWRLFLWFRVVRSLPFSSPPPFPGMVIPVCRITNLGADFKLQLSCQVIFFTHVWCSSNVRIWLFKCILKTHGHLSPHNNFVYSWSAI